MDKQLITLNLTKEQLAYLVEILEENSDNGCSLGNLPSSSLWNSILHEASQALASAADKDGKVADFGGF